MEKVRVKRTVKPYSSEEVKEMAAKHLDGKSTATYAGDQVMECQPLPLDRNRCCYPNLLLVLCDLTIAYPMDN